MKHILKIFITIILILSPIIITSTEAEYKEDFSNKQYIAELVDVYAEKYDVNKKTMHLIVFNESRYNYKAIGDGGNSHGLAQINMRFWSNKFTKDEAYNPHIALEFLAKELKAGKGRQWTTFRTCILGEKLFYQGKQILCETNINV